MTFIHFVNCVGITYAPLYITYKSSLLREYGQLSMVLWAMLGYLLTQGVKMILLASLLPGSDIDDNTFSLVSEILKSIISVVDVFGVGYVFEKLNGGAAAKIWGVGLGWATAEAIGSRLAPLYVSAWQGEFEWTSVLQSLDSNTRIILHIAFCSLVFCIRRKHVKASVIPYLVLGIATYCAWPSVVFYLTSFMGFGTLEVLIADAIFAVVLAVFARAMFSA
eukprot:TRINITY_DN508_c0_g1_i1.p1 TRINITY_DN508_c0_g1~~TRINITY_DN508_c0_g1_i1.p1  ORF type:complete len:221 (-),score=31.36 TRINITY_DN508_c0_g1_i1:352-1014(-)